MVFDKIKALKYVEENLLFGMQPESQKCMKIYIPVHFEIIYNPLYL